MICIGVGPTVYRIRCGGIWLVIRLVPIDGYVLLPPPLRDRRQASSLITAAGPSANLIAAAALWALAEALPDILVFSWLTPQAFFLIASVLPYTGKINGFSRVLGRQENAPLSVGPDHDIVAGTYADTAAKLRPGVEPPERRMGFREIVLQPSRSDRAEAWGRRQAIDALAAFMAAGTLNTTEAEATTHFIHAYVDAERAAFREERRSAHAGRWRTWRRPAISVRRSWLVDRGS